MSYSIQSDPLCRVLRNLGEQYYTTLADATYDEAVRENDFAELRLDQEFHEFFQQPLNIIHLLWIAYEIKTSDVV